MARHGRPERMLTDNGAVFTGLYRGRGWVALERELAALGIGLSHCRPYHPQTCGKVERFHQTLKKWLARQDPAATIGGLQTQLDTFAAYYNPQRPHRAIGRRTPAEAWKARPRAIPARQGIHSASTSASAATASTPTANSPCATTAGSTTSASAAAGPGTSVLILARELKIASSRQDTGELIRELTLDPARDYQPTGRPRGYEL